MFTFLFSLDTLRGPEILIMEEEEKLMVRKRYYILKKNLGTEVRNTVVTETAGDVVRKLGMENSDSSRSLVQEDSPKILTAAIQGCTAVQQVYNTFCQFISQVELYFQLQLSLQSDPITLGAPIVTW